MLEFTCITIDDDVVTGFFLFEHVWFVSVSTEMTWKEEHDFKLNSIRNGTAFSHEQLVPKASVRTIYTPRLETISGHMI